MIPTWFNLIRGFGISSESVETSKQTFLGQILLFFWLKRARMWTLSYDIVPKFFFFESSGNSRAGRNDFKQICECSEVWRDIETWIFRYPIFSSHQQWIGILIHRSILRVICLNPVAPNDTWRDLDSPQACDGRDQRQPQSMPWRSPGLRLAATGCDWRLAWAEANAIPSTQHFECLGLDFGVENPSGTAEAEIFPYSEADSPQEFLRVLRAGSGKHLKFMDRS